MDSCVDYSPNAGLEHKVCGNIMQLTLSSTLRALKLSFPINIFLDLEHLF